MGLDHWKTACWWYKTRQGTIQDIQRLWVVHMGRWRLGKSWYSLQKRVV